VAASTLNTIIQKSECHGSYSKLLAAVADWPSNEKYGKTELEVFVDAMMYEPADLSGHEGPHEYIFGKPKKNLCWYLEMLADDGDDVVDGPETLLCSDHSCDDGKHLFLKAEGHVTCSND